MISENSPRARIVVAEVGGCAPVETLAARARIRGDDVQRDRHHDREAIGPATDATSPGSIVSPNAKKNTAANVSRSGSTSLRDPARPDVSARIEADHERADRVGDAELLGDARREHGEPDEADGEQLVVVGVDEAADDVRRRSGR